jgi:hypothetical protein
MYERVPPDKDAEDDRSPAAPDTFEVERPKVQSQDLEHQPRPGTRVPNTGVKVKPPMVDDPGNRDLEKEREKAGEAKPGKKPG